MEKDGKKKKKTWENQATLKGPVLLWLYIMSKLVSYSMLLDHENEVSEFCEVTCERLKRHAEN